MSLNFIFHEVSSTFICYTGHRTGTPPPTGPKEAAREGGWVPASSPAPASMETTRMGWEPIPLARGDIWSANGARRGVGGTEARPGTARREAWGPCKPWSRGVLGAHGGIRVSLVGWI